MKSKLITVIASAMTLGLSMAGNANADITARCGALKGQSVYAGMDLREYQQQGNSAPIHAPKFETDGMSGSSVVFLLEERDATTLKIAWNSKKNNTELVNLPIVMNQSDQVTAIERSGGGVWMYTIYPKLGSLFVTRHTHWKYPAASGSLFVAKCQLNGDW